MEKARPFLKWAGGKTQLLPELMRYVPRTYGKYIEPFLGAGALFFHLRPEHAVLADLNDELIDCYTVVRDHVEELIKELRKYKNDENFYYRLRDKDPDKLGSVRKAARTIYLNHTGFNGLYRVNKLGKFNVPFGRRKSPTICDEPRLLAAHNALQGVELVSGDYKAVLEKYARSGDFVYLDPPYYPAGGFAEFKRYTKEFFYEEDHVELRDTVSELVNRSCYVLLTNSNTDFVRKLYNEFDYKAIDTRRNISSNAATRTGEDIIVIGTRDPHEAPVSSRSHNLLENFPGTRYMGSKYRVLPFIWQCVEDLHFRSVLDAFSGSNCVSYMFKQYGKRVISNDFMHFAYHFAKAIIENSTERLNETDIALLLTPNSEADTFIADTFRGLYFTDEENKFLDLLRANIELLDKPEKRSLALAAISRACMKRRPRGIFTYVGERYNDGRRDMQIDLRQHFLENVDAFNKAVFDNGEDNLAFNSDVFDLASQADLVYLDPPYFTPISDNDYVRRYHFIEGLVRRWQGVEIQMHTTTKKFKRYETPFMSKDTVADAFDRLFQKFQDSILVVSYSSNSLPSKEDLVGKLKKYKKHVRVHQVELTYSFGTQAHKVGDNANRAREFVFVAY